MDIKPIKSEADYRATLREIEGLMGSKADTPEGDRLDVLVTLVQAYEARHYPMDYPDPVEAIKFRMEQQGLTVDDLAPAIGRSNRVYEVLNGKRSLSVAMIRRLHRQFDIPADVLIRESEDKRNERVESA